ncbi:MAG: hypothetical protein FWG39_02190 [Alphaproteobacteria bacterium]|nr:hypothetical protein [Alphaproteobacteria bacterium]
MNKKLILTMTVGGVLFVGSPAMANIASQVYVDREVAAVGERVTTNEGDITTLQGTVAGHTTAIAGKAALAGVGADGVIAAVDADGQFVRDASGLTIQTLATHVQGKVADAIDAAVTEATTTLGGDVTALSGRVTTAEGTIAGHTSAITALETEKANIGDLSALAMAPVECSDEINSCVLTTNGTTLNWEVIKR